jgi:hypothetical protein
VADHAVLEEGVDAALDRDILLLYRFGGHAIGLVREVDNQ